MANRAKVRPKRRPRSESDQSRLCGDLTDGVGKSVCRQRLCAASFGCSLALFGSLTYRPLHCVSRTRSAQSCQPSELRVSSQLARLGSIGSPMETRNSAARAHAHAHTPSGPFVGARAHTQRRVRPARRCGASGGHCGRSFAWAAKGALFVVVACAINSREPNALGHKESQIEPKRGKGPNSQTAKQPKGQTAKEPKEQTKSASQSQSGLYEALFDCADRRFACAHLSRVCGLIIIPATA